MKKYFNETLAEVMQRPPHKPLRTLVELANEFGVHHNALLKALKNHDGPSSIIGGYVRGGHKTWYEPIAVRKWWNEYISRSGEVK